MDRCDQPVFRRVMLKLSGESFCRPGQGGLSLEEISRIARRPPAWPRETSSSRSSWAAETSCAERSFRAALT